MKERSCLENLTIDKGILSDGVWFRECVRLSSGFKKF